LGYRCSALANLAVQLREQDSLDELRQELLQPLKGDQQLLLLRLTFLKMTFLSFVSFLGLEKLCYRDEERRKISSWCL
jgi:hypothetical protein